MMNTTTIRIIYIKWINLIKFADFFFVNEAFKDGGRVVYLYVLSLKKELLV